MSPGIRSVMVGECSSGDTVFVQFCLEKKKTGSITSTVEVSNLVPVHIKESVIKFVLGVNMGAWRQDKTHYPSAIQANSTTN